MRMHGPLCDFAARCGHDQKHESCSEIMASARADRLSDDDLRELARIIRRVHVRTAARHERERLDAGAGPCQCEVCGWVRRSGAQVGAT